MAPAFIPASEMKKLVFQLSVTGRSTARVLTNSTSRMNEYKRPEKTIKGFVDCKVGDDIG